MKRFTVKRSDGSYTIADSEVEEAISRLGLFEDAYEDLLDSIERIPVELKAMRTEGKEKTVRYKETVTQKLINNNIVAFFERHGLKNDGE